jgi:1-acyl-sn-glycerol-3-phosphate acyltransferase
MEITLDHLAQLSPEMARTLLPQWLGSFVQAAPEHEAAMVDDVRSLLERAPDAQIAEALAHLLDLGSDYALYRFHPLTQQITRRYMSALMHEATVGGLAHLRTAVDRGPCLLISNHLAYCDTQVTDLLLSQHGANDIAQSIVAVAGPKVYGTAFRRMASAGLNTLKTAQSAVMAHNVAQLSPREVGRIAIQTVHCALELMGAGQLILIYGEGARSRDGRLQPFLKAVRKYAALPKLQVVPLAISGTQRMMPLHQAQMFDCPVHLEIGPALDVGPQDRVGAILSAWDTIGGMLPDENKPAVGTSQLA